MSIYTCKAIVMYINKLYTTQLITFISPFCTLSKLRCFHAPARRFLRLLITNYVYKNAIIIFILSPYGPPKKRSFHCIVVPRIWCHNPVMYINELHISHTRGIISPLIPVIVAVMYITTLRPYTRIRPTCYVHK
jgi:hypothetical protein